MIIENAMKKNENNESNNTEIKSNLKTHKRDIFFFVILIILTILFPFGVLLYLLAGIIFKSVRSKWDIYSIAVSIICIILFPFGVIDYLWGRMNLHPLGLVLPFWGILGTLLVFFVVNLVRIFRKNTLKKRFLILVEICLPLFFVLNYFFVHLSLISKDPYLCGYGKYIKGQINIEDVQGWLKQINDENASDDNNSNSNKKITFDEYPKSLKESRYNKIGVDLNSFHGPTISTERGSGFLHWGFIIGTKDFKYSEEEMKKKIEDDEDWLLVQPGFYVFVQY